MEGPAGNGGETPRRVAALETGLQRVQGRLENLERSNRAIQTDIRSMKDQIMSMQSSIQEMLMIFRNLSAKVKRQNAEGQPARAPAPAGRAERAVSRRPSDELVRDPRHLREGDDDLS